MSTQKVPLKPGFSQRAKANEMPIASLIGFEAQDSARFPLLMGEC
jgi:hypothetical protein